MEVYDCIEQRRTVRRFLDKPVGKSKIDRIIEAGIYAPSQKNQQPWRFDIVVGKVRDAMKDVLQKTTLFLEDILPEYTQENLAEVHTFFENIGNAPVLIVVTHPKVTSDFNTLNTLLGVGGCIQNMQLAAFNEKLGAVCLTTSYYVKNEICELLGIKNREISTVLAIGYPVQEVEFPGRRKDLTHWHE